MKIVLLLLVISVLFWGFSFPYMLRAFARVRADQTTYGHRPATEKLLRRLIGILTWSNMWVSNNEGPDSRRIARLRVLLKKMQNPHD